MITNKSVTEKGDKLIAGDVISSSKNQLREPTRNIDEVKEMFKIPSSEKLWKMVIAKEFPEPDLVVSRLSNPKAKKAYWRLSTLKKEVMRRKKLINVE